MGIVLGMGYGDEGKGLTTSYLCQKAINKGDVPLVVRFNGGHQAGHTVLHEGERHVFSNFGAGTLQGAKTCWSEFCTFYPGAFYNEYFALEEIMENIPKVYVHALCPVTTPFDVLANQIIPANHKYGSVGVGFGQTLQRHDAYYKLFVQDLFYPSILRAKLENITRYYLNIIPNSDSMLKVINPSEINEEFIVECEKIKDKITVINDYSILDCGYELIYEGAQGILLDMDYGFFPNVTRSNTTSRNALSLRHSYDIYYVTRTYQTRHGNGFMSNEDKPVSLVNNELETNFKNQFQGEFRTGILDVDMLNYALMCDGNHSKRGHKKNLVITCVDQTGEDFYVTVGGKEKRINLEDLPKMLNVHMDTVLYSTGASQEDIKELKYSTTKIIS